MLNWIVWNRTVWSFKLSPNKWLMLSWIVRNRSVWSFNCVQTNNWCLIELLVIHSNTWNYLTLLINVYKSYLIYMNKLDLGSACGVMVIVIGNGHGDTSSNPGRDWLHFTLH